MFKLHISTRVHVNSLYRAGVHQDVATFVFATKEALTAAYELLLATKDENTIVKAEVEEEVTTVQRRYVEKSLEELKGVRVEQNPIPRSTHTI